MYNKCSLFVRGAQNPIHNLFATRYKQAMKLDLPDGDYPFIDQRIPLAELSMIEVPADLERLLVEQVTRNGLSLSRDTPFELRCETKEFGEATFLIYWPEGHRMHMLAPKEFVVGRG